MPTPQTGTHETASPSGLSGQAAAADLLLEIGTEELPYQFIAPARQALETAAAELFAAQRLTHRTIRTVATPRRLTLLVEGLARQQATAMKEAMGPPKAAAFDASGQPTKAAVGFAASQGVEVSALEVRELPKGAYLFAVKREDGRPAQAVLQEHLGTLITGLTFPKAMKWNESGFRFARPVRWIAALHGSQVLDVEVGGIRSGARTYGHRVLGGAEAAKGLALKDAGDYMSALDRAGVVVDPATRRQLITRLLADLATQAKGQVRADETLVDQAVYAVEKPAAILGSFDPKFLRLPPDVIETAMKEHQGFFALRDGQGRLLPNFLAVVNIVATDMTAIRKGNERVLAARLSDAAFYFGEDQKVSLNDRVAKLDAVVFHQRLGTMGQKTQRVTELAGWLAGAVGEAGLEGTCRRAAAIAKADLTTGVVGEFPALQGVMGGVYAEAQGEPSEVAVAIRDQYLPRGMDGEIPAARAAQCVSLADRFDSMAAFFAAGMTPKGSEDPFALRRHALSIVRIIVEGGLKLDVAATLRWATEAVLPHLKARASEAPKAPSSSTPSAIPAPGESAAGKPKAKPRVADDPLPFLLERFRFYAANKFAFRPDVIEAVTGRVTADAKDGGAVDLLDLLERLRAVQTMAGQPAFDPLIVGFKRAHRLVQKESWTATTVSPGVLQHAAEHELHQALTQAQQSVAASMSRADYAGALGALVRLKEPIDAFFANVMVNAEEAALRANRLSLLALIDAVFLQVADFSVVVEPGGA